MYDLLIKNAKIYDGTGADLMEGNIWVEDGKVAGLAEIEGGVHNATSVKGEGNFFEDLLVLRQPF